jgi:type IV secretory pathway VirD2 relaxase
MYAQRVVVKARVVRNRGTGGRRTMRDHESYLERDGVDQEGGKGRTFGELDYLSKEEVDSFIDRSADDRHHFRFIVSPERGADLELVEFTRDLMSQATQDLGTRLEWMAVAHYNTDNPHVHVILRGIDERGADLVISRQYISQHFRERAQEIATRELGLRVEQELENERAAELTANRITSLDRQLEREGARSDGVIDLRPPAHAIATSWQERERLEKISRVHHLEGLELAEERAPGRWTLAPDALDRLRDLAAGERLSTSFYRLMARDYEFSSIKLYDKSQPDEPRIVGELVARGKLDELADRDTVFVASNSGATAGRVYRLTLGAFSERADQPLRMGQVVALSVHRAADVSAADYSILAIAKDNFGEYSKERHRERLEERARGDRIALAEVDERVEHTVMRIESHERRGLVEHVQSGVWRVPENLPELLREYAGRQGDRRLTPRIEAVSHLTLDEQIDARGATWLDSELQRQGESPATDPEGVGTAPRRLTAALQQRVQSLRGLGVLGRDTKVTQETLDRLYGLELEEAAREIEARARSGVFISPSKLGIPELPASAGRTQTIEGTVNSVEWLPSGPHVVINTEQGFTLLPAGSRSTQQIGRRVAARITTPVTSDPARPQQLQTIVRYVELEREREKEKGRERGE